jgi:signal transduction histidine kinase
VGAQFRNGQRWRELAYALPGAILDWLLASIPLYLLVLGIGEMLAPFNPFESGLFESRVLSPASHWLLAWGDSALGFVTFVLAIPLVWVCARAQTALMRLFLAPSRHAMAARLGEIERSKRAAVEAETASFNRIERDLHDGPQQSLLRSGLDLAAVERRLASGDVDGARTLVAEVRTRNDQTLNDIRTLSRGFAPPVLADKGLREAVASLAATSPIPASVNTELAGVRPPEAIERAIYFAVSESLANAAKHSHASRVAIDVRQSPAGVSAVIADNGTGGAIQVPGHGLAGLADRLASVGGTLTVTSEPGQGTVVRVDVTLR